MQSEEYVCVCVCVCERERVRALPSDGLLSYSDTWRSLIGREHPSGHLVCGPRGVYARACVAYVCV